MDAVTVRYTRALVLRATFVRLWKFRDVWLLFISKQQYIVLPVGQLPPEALDLVDTKVGAGGKPK